MADENVPDGSDEIDLGNTTIVCEYRDEYLEQLQRMVVAATAIDHMARKTARLGPKQLRDVIDGRVSMAALVLYLAIQLLVGARERKISDQRLGFAIKKDPRSVRRGLQALEAMGWIVRSRGMDGERQIMIPRLDEEERALLENLSVVRTAGVHELNAESPVRTPGVRTEERNFETSAGTPLALSGRSYPDPEGSNAQGGSGGRTQRAKRKQADLPAYLVDFAKALLDVYPHGVQPTGRLRKPSSTDVAKALRPLLEGREDRQELMGAIMAGCQAEASVAPPLDDDARKYVKGLEVWVRARGWENPPEFARAGGTTAPAPDAKAQADAARKKLLDEIEHMETVIAEHGANERNVNRLNLFRSKAGLPPKFLNVTQRDTGPASASTGGHSTALPSTPGRVAPRGPDGPSGASGVAGVGGLVGQLRKQVRKEGAE